MAFTSADLAALDAALLRGRLEVQYGDRRTRYNSIAEMLSLRKVMLAEIVSAQDVATQAPRQFFGTAGKGLC